MKLGIREIVVYEVWDEEIGGKRIAICETYKEAKHLLDVILFWKNYKINKIEEKVKK